MTTLDMSTSYRPIEVPRKIATCPICDASISVEEVQEWECETGKPVGISVNCDTEPDIDSDEWPDWFHHHWSMPYVDWLPVENRVLKWFQRNYKCE